MTARVAASECSIEGCTREYRARGYCVYHWAEYRNSPQFVSVLHSNRRPTEYGPDYYAARLERVLRQTTASESGCWVFTGGLQPAGYARISVANRRQYGHRFVYEQMVGPIPDGLQIDHLCRNRACCNPAHLEPVTNRENGLRGESPSAQCARKTHCLRGHELAGDNLQITAQGKRFCRECGRLRARLRQAARRASRPPWPPVEPLPCRKRCGQTFTYPGPRGAHEKFCGAEAEDAERKVDRLLDELLGGAE